jgi:hypothetical protein
VKMARRPAIAPAPRPAVRLLLLVAVLLGSLALGGCVVVPQNRRGRLADPMMSFSGSRMDGYRRDKLHSTREGAAGGNGRPAGGGCACQ